MQRLIRTGAVVALALATIAADGEQREVSTAEISEMMMPIVDMTLPIASIDQSIVIQRSGITLAADVLFAFDSAALGPHSRSPIQVAVAEIRARDPSSIVIEGHTDHRGSHAYNRNLSRRRAESVQRELRRRLGADAPVMRIEARGESDPVASNTDPSGEDNPKGRALNRRVEVLVAE